MTPGRPPVGRRRGATVYELLIVTAVLAVFVTIGFVALGRLGRQVELQRESTTFVQDLQFVRARALATSTPWRLRVIDADSYELERWTGAAWEDQREVDLDGYSFGNLLADDTFAFDERGVGAFEISGEPTTEVRLVAADGSGLRIVPSLTGSVRSAGL